MAMDHAGRDKLTDINGGSEGALIAQLRFETTPQVERIKCERNQGGQIC